MVDYALGIMSGTSMDGIDVALIDPNSHNLIDAEIYPYSASVTKRLREVMAGEAFDMHFFSRLNRDVGLEFANAAASLMHRQNADIHENLKVIGMHGQTICHAIQNDDAYTWQIGSPYPLFEMLKKPVVYDFRSKNVIQGGQGAPLAPIYHAKVFSKQLPAVIVNIGGISNITCLINDAIYGFDIGPGNCLMDAWIASHLGLDYDKDARWAKTGIVNHELLGRILKDNYFQLLPPKSIGKEYFSLNWLKDYLTGLNLSPEDVQASLCYLTASIIATTVQDLSKDKFKVLICGGGSKNQCLMAHLKTLLTAHDVMTTDELGVSSDYLEAMMMAYLAWLRIEKHPLDLSQIMGGKNNQVHGIICE